MAPPRPPARHSHPALPFLAVALGIATFSMMDASMKTASMEAGVYVSLLLRNTAGTLLILPLWRMTGGTWPARPALKVHALRSAVVTMMASLFFWGLVRMPMAEALALTFIAPLIALFLAAVLLGERIQPSAILASLLGLAGVGVIAAARFGEGGEASVAGLLAVLASAVFYAWNLVLQRQQAQVAGPVEVALFQNLFVGLFLLLAAPAMVAFNPDLLAAPPSPLALAAIVAAAVLTGVSLMLLTWGYARAETQALVSIEYTAFLWAALFGWLVFGEKVGPASLAGAALIVLGCLIGTRKPAAAGFAAGKQRPAP